MLKSSRRHLLGRKPIGPRLRSSLVTIGGNLAGAGAALLASIVAARTLGTTGFAFFGVGLAVNSLVVQLADLGAGVVAVAETAGERTGGDRVLASSKLHLLIVGRIRSAAVVVALAATVVLVTPGIDAYRTGMLIGVTGAFLGSLTLFPVALLQGARQFDRAAAVLATVGFVRLALIGMVAAVGGSPSEMLFAYAVLAPLAGCAAGTAFLARTGMRPVRTELHRVILDVSRRRLMVVAALASAAVLNGDVLLLVALSTDREVAIYAVAWRVAAGFSVVNAAIASALLPYVMTSKDPRSDVERLARIGMGATVLVLLLAPAVVALGVYAFDDVGRGATWPLALLVAAFALDAFITFVYQSYIRVNRTALPVANTILELAIMVAVTISLRAHGALAPAMGQFASRAVGACVVGLPILLERNGKLAWFDTSVA